MLVIKRFSITCLDNDCVKVFQSFWGEHGLSFLVETEQQSVLFDAGTTPTVMEHNLKLLGKDLSQVSHVILSHAHYDHTGALGWVLQQTRNPVLVADPDVFVSRFSRRDGKLKPTGVPIEKAEAEAHAQLLLTEEMVKIGDGITVTGRVPRLNPYEVSNPKMVIQQGEDLATDEFLDDRSLILETEKGIVVLLGCCHAGLINTLVYVRQHFDAPILAIAGGTHLLEASPERLAWTIEEMESKYHPERLYFNHCTGMEAQVAFRNALGARAQSLPAGEVLTF
ncbi:MAG: MBL fold metallo-hydrolase [Chloroflexi bacterium]|nr:MBL fold metallo-hydrolase [Chloroflexota bacterium]